MDELLVYAHILQRAVQNLVKSLLGYVLYRCLEVAAIFLKQ